MVNNDTKTADNEHKTIELTGVESIQVQHKQVDYCPYSPPYSPLQQMIEIKTEAVFDEAIELVDVESVSEETSVKQERAQLATERLGVKFNEREFQRALNQVTYCIKDVTSSPSSSEPPCKKRKTASKSTMNLSKFVCGTS